MSLSSIAIMKPEVHWNLRKSNIRKRHNVSFVGLGGFYSIFQHTDGKRPHSMACRGQHGWEFTEPEMIAKIIRIGSSRRVTSWDASQHAWCGGAWWHITSHQARRRTHGNVASSLATLVSEGTRLTACLENNCTFLKKSFIWRGIGMGLNHFIIILAMKIR